MKKTLLLLLGLCLSIAISAGNSLDLKDITSGAFRGETISAVKALADGETYAQLSSDGHRIVQYSFKTGKEVSVLFDTQTDIL